MVVKYTSCFILDASKVDGKTEYAPGEMRAITKSRGKIKKSRANPYPIWNLGPLHLAPHVPAHLVVPLLQRHRAQSCSIHQHLNLIF